MQQNIFIFILFIIILGGAYYFFHSSWQRTSAVKTASTTDTKKELMPKTDGIQVGRQNNGHNQSIDVQVNSIIKKMTLQEKVGQLLMVGFYGAEEDDYTKSLIRNQKIGGIILFDRNMKNPSQVAHLTNQLKNEESRNNLPLPLLISADQEGGNVLRMRSQISPIPSEQELGRNATPKEVYNIAKINGQEMNAMGIQLDFAPVLDLSAQDQRSFGSNPVRSTNLDEQEIKGLNASNVTATLKHFPGNGRVIVDPHLDTSIVKADRNMLEKVDMIPFQQIIQQQDENQFFVMATHVQYPAFDKKMPASLSKTIIQGLLRDQLGYKGIVITDDLDMGAISNYYSYSDLGYLALNAGADILLVCHEYNHQLELYNGIIKDVKNGKLSEARIDQSLKRILTFKLKYLSNKPVSEKNAREVVKSSKHLHLLASYQKSKFK